METNFSDFELIYMIHQKDEVALDILLNKYHRMLWGLIHTIVKEKNLVGMHLDDLYQEATLGFMEAIYGYREDQKTLFITFLRVCVDRKIRTAIRRMHAQNYTILSRSVSLDACIRQDESLYMADILPAAQSYEPSWRFYYQESANQAKQIAQDLSPFEKKVYLLKRANYSYKQIAEQLNCTQKQIDNTLQRIRKKFEEIRSD